MAIQTFITTPSAQIHGGNVYIIRMLERKARRYDTGFDVAITATCEKDAKDRLRTMYPGMRMEIKEVM